MPHVSGGGGFSGGTHGFYGFLHNSRNGAIRYFPGSKIHKRNVNDGSDWYLNGRTTKKSSILSIVAVSILAVFVTFVVSLTVDIQTPVRLASSYTDSPKVDDDALLIYDDESLMHTLKEYQELTGICPVIYTVYEETWKATNSKLSDYAYYLYVSNYKDEEHFVVVCSVPKADAGSEKPSVTIVAVQGDLTDPFITGTSFRKFKNIVRKDIKRGEDPGVALDNAFRYGIEDTAKRMNPTTSQRASYLLTSLLPVIISSAIFITVITVMIVRFVKAKKNREFEVLRENDPKMA